MRNMIYAVVDDCLDHKTLLRITPTASMHLKDKVFILQLFTDTHDNKQIWVSKEEIDIIIAALEKMRE